MRKFSQGSSQTIEIPDDRSELAALRARREELRDQLESVTQRRGQLVQERLNAQAAANPAVARELDGRISELGERSVRLERELTQADDAISTAIANGVGTQSQGGAVSVGGGGIAEIAGRMPRVISIPPFQRDTSTRDTIVLMAGEALAFVLLGFVLWRMAFRRGTRAALQSAGPRDVSQLQQSIDAIAVEVERISENQRFVTRLLNESGSAASPVEAAKARDAGR